MVGIGAGFLKRIVALTMTLLLVGGGILSVAIAECAHSNTEWRTDWDSKSVTGGYVWQRKYCKTCGKQLDFKIMAMSMVNEGKFIFTPNEFGERLEKISKAIDNQYITQLAEVDGELVCAVRNESNDVIAAIQFTDQKDLLAGTEHDKANISAIMVYCYTEDMSEVVAVTLATILCCDSSLKKTDAVDVASNVITYSTSGKAYKHNDVSYAMSTTSNGNMVFVASVLNK